MKEEALELADELDEASKLESDLNRPENEADFQKASALIRRLVEELDKQGEPVASWLKMGLPQAPQTKPLSDDEIIDIWFAIPNGTLKARTIDFARAIEERILNK